MRHSSIRLEESPIEFINITPLNPLISKCQIKVCYVGDEPNRNHSVITKEVATQMANSLPGSPIVGYFNEANSDYEEHNRIIDVSNGKFEIKDTTKPYGFVDLGAKVWFQKFLDDGQNEREYLMTEGYLWTEQYPECKRILTQGNNQSMELDEKTLDASWTKDGNGKYKFFIINEAIISKLCILGEDCEPCFEGANITAPTIQFSFDDGFKEQLFSMMTELKELLQEGGEKVFNQYSVNVGDNLFVSIYNHLNEGDNANKYFLKSVYEDGDQKFALVAERDSGKLFRMNFSYAEEDSSTVFSAESLTEVEDGYVPAENPVFSLEDIEAFENEYKKKEDKTDEGASNKTEDNSEGEKCPECGKPIDECTCEKEKKGDKKFSLDEIPEYTELQTKYNELETKYNALVEDLEKANQTIGELNQFKLAADRKEKQAMIDSFYMLGEEEKKDVLENIDTYSLNDIEAKLSIICVRNKVSFGTDNEVDDKGPTTYSLENNQDDAGMPAWVKAAVAVAKSMN